MTIYGTGTVGFNAAQYETIRGGGFLYYKKEQGQKDASFAVVTATPESLQAAEKAGYLVFDYQHGIPA